MNLEGKRAIVTGSTQGIGLAIAKALVGERANLVISSRDERRVLEVTASLKTLSNATVFGKACDVREPEQVKSLVSYCAEKLGGLEILVNNAGVGLFRKVEEITPEEWRTVLATNLDGVFYACHYGIPVMKKSREGFIINISSLAGKNAFATASAYNASKFALTGFSEALMQEVRYDNIRVAYIMPGSVDTAFREETGASWKLSPEDIAQVVIETLKRPARCLTSRIEMRPSKPPK